jgi:hypothetical protein
MDTNSPFKHVMSIRPYLALYETSPSYDPYGRWSQVIDIKTWTADRTTVGGQPKWRWNISKWSFAYGANPNAQDYKNDLTGFDIELTIDGSLINTATYSGWNYPWNRATSFTNTTPYVNPDWYVENGLPSNVRLYYTKTPTDYYSDIDDFQVTAGDVGGTTASNHVFMSAINITNGITFPGSTVDIFDVDASLTASAAVIRGITSQTLTVDTTSDALGGYALYGSGSATVDTTATASGLTLILVFGSVGEISTDVVQTQTVQVIQGLLNQDALASDLTLSSGSLLNITTVAQTLASEFDITPLMGLARFGAALLEGDGFLMSDSFVIRLDDYFLVNIAPESRIIVSGPENRFPLVEPETRSNSTLAEHKYYLVEPETRQYKITANKATQIGRRTRRLEQ